MNKIEVIDQSVVRWMSIHGVRLLRWSLGLIFFWFGFLKFFPGLSPAEELAAHTITTLSLHLLEKSQAIMLIATWECVIGLGLLFGVYPRLILLLLFLQLSGTFTPLILFPGETFIHFPYAPTLEGQYIIKNLILVSAGIVIGSTVREKDSVRY